MQKAVDTARFGVGVAEVIAPGAGHPECGSHDAASPEIKFATTHGGARPGAGRKPKPPSVAVLAPEAEGPRWYVFERDRGRPPRMLAGETLAEAVERVMRAAAWSVVMPQYRATDGQLRQAFPGYGLVEFDRRDEGWRALAQVPGVRRIIGADAERPTPVAAVQAAWVLGQFGPDGVQRLPVERAPALPLPKGLVVRVVGGLGLGWRGVVEQSDGRTVVLVVDGRRVRMAQAGGCGGMTRPLLRNA